MIITYDTREKYPWDFSIYNCTMLRDKVDTGDYSVKGLEHLLCIERKRNTGEIYINIGCKWKPFKAELDRMKTFKYKFIVCEFDIKDFSIFPHNSGIPEQRWPSLKMRKDFLQKKFLQESCNREIEVIFAGNKSNAEEKVYELMYNIYQHEIR